MKGGAGPRWILGWFARAAALAVAGCLAAPAAPAAADVFGTSVDPLFPVRNLEFSGQVATFKSSFGGEPFSATIFWGDGTPESVGTVGPPEARGSAFVRSVSGSHTYARNGTYRVTVVVQDSLGNTDTDENVATVTDCFCVNKFPRVGRTVDIGPVSGRSFIKLPGRGSAAASSASSSRGFTRLRKSREVPVGTQFDTRRGSIVALAATGRPGDIQGGRFSRGLFTLRQSSTGLVDLRIKRASTRVCGQGASAQSARRRSRRVLRRLSGSVKGKYRTTGSYSAGTVRGTEWTTTDRCDGTLTTVRRGSVSVRDFRRGRTVVVRAGHRYLARAPR